MYADSTELIIRKVICRSHQLSYDVANTCTPPSQKHPHLHPHYAVLLRNCKLAKLEVKSRHHFIVHECVTL